MDPITRMAEDFMKSWLRFRQSKKASFFRIETDPSMHTDLWRVFRAIEMSPDNRSPYLMFAMPFTNPRQFYLEAVQKLVADYELLREGSAKDGVSIGPLSLPTGTGVGPEEWFVFVLQMFWEQVKKQFEYLMIVFLPERIENKDEWAQSIARVVSLLPLPAVRFAVADAQEPTLTETWTKLDRQALSGRFFIASEKVQEYLLKVAEGGWGALSEDNVASTSKPPQRQAAPLASSEAGNTKEAQPVSSDGQKVLPSDEAKRLRVSMAKAAMASSEQRILDAVEWLREAQLICRKNGLSTHEAVIVMAIANNFLACQQMDEAISHYEVAIKIAAEASAPVVVMQARMGLGAALFHRQFYDLAALAYEQAAHDARSAESEVMRIEALRMAGACHTAQGRFDGAADCWNRALESAGKLPLAEVNASTFAQVGEQFAALCREHGLAEQAKSVAQQVEVIRHQAELREKESAEIVVSS